MGRMLEEAQRNTQPPQRSVLTMKRTAREHMFDAVQAADH